jgi:phosphoribosylformylglycinamidine (FGAM) synthase-like enzyme
MRPDYFLFSESLGRFVVTVDPDNKRAFERTLGSDAVLLGRVKGTRLRVTAQELILDLPVSELETAYKAPFRGY